MLSMAASSLAIDPALRTRAKKLGIVRQNHPHPGPLPSDGRGRIVLRRSAYPTTSKAARDGSGCSLSRRVCVYRYSAARQNRKPRSADWQSAVSRIGNPPAPADCQSAKQQITNMRYAKSSRPATIWTDTDRLQGLRYGTRKHGKHIPDGRGSG